MTTLVVPPHEGKTIKAARVRLGSYEFEKKGISRFDMRDPYHLAIALTWPQFLTALLALYLFVNVAFATLFWLVPGSVANAEPDSFSDAFFFSIETLATVGYGEMYPATAYGRLVAGSEIVCGLDLPRFRGEMRAWDQALWLYVMLSSGSWHSLVRPPAEPFFRPDPRTDAAAARSGGQGRPLAAAARRACP